MIKAIKIQRCVKSTYSLLFLSMASMQAPGGPEEDTSGGFKYGGWTATYFDEFSMNSMLEQITPPLDLLLGKTTYDIFAGYWPQHTDNPIGDAFEKAQKYVASHEPFEPTWANTTVLTGDVANQIKQLKSENGPDLQVHGSGNFIQTLLKNDLVDELWLKIFPITLGPGKRLFAEGTIPAAFELIETKTSPSGVIFANYKRGGEIKPALLDNIRNMELQLTQEDPLNILGSTKLVLENSKHVFINHEKLKETAQKIKERFQQGIGSQEMGYTVTGNLENDVQLIFIEDVVNFCFWASKNEPKWQIELADGGATEGGWFGLQACFERGLKEGVPILDPHYLSSFSLGDAKHFFRGINEVSIPLLEERTKNLQEAGRVLIEKFDGKFINALESSNFDAIKLAKIIIENFSSFRDVSIYNNHEIAFFKRAQICTNDFNYILKSEDKSMTNLSKLTAFADYKLPQILRLFEVFGIQQRVG
jgi:dihydrofolate reductase